ncbi:DUF5687 family protein [Marinoscillum sp.]|uniref:DUF5687 family protein n=1 Tax=Marinoscillum sp. TaxID=2024838 RepID=UPI003BA973A6
MIDLFYLKHRWKAFVRNPGSMNSLWVGLLFGLMVLLIDIGVSNNWPLLLESISTELGIAIDKAPYVILWGLFLTDLLTKVLLPKSIPKVYYYHTLNVNPRDLKVGYLIEALCNLWFLLMLGVEALVITLCVGDLGIGLEGVLGMAFLWLLNSLISILIHSSDQRSFIFSLLGLLVILQVIVFKFPAYLPTIDGLTFLILVSASIIPIVWLVYRKLDSLFDRALKASDTSTNYFVTGLDLFKDPLMQLEVATIMRNKRARGTAITGILMIPYFFIIGSKSMDSPIFQMMISLLISGLFIFQMGTYIFAWEGSFFDLLLTRFSTRQIIEHKYRFFTYTSLFFALVMAASLAIVYRGSLFLPLACFLYNIGWNVPIIINNGFRNTEKIDLTRGIFMNYQGFNGMVIVTMFTTLLPPIVIYGVLNNLVGSLEAIMTLTLLGVIGITLRRVFINSLSKKLELKKYYLSSCYRS